MAKKVAEEPKNEQIINTEAVKAKAAELGENVKEGANKVATKLKENKNIVTIVAGVAACFVALLILILIVNSFTGPKHQAKVFSKSLVKLNEKKYCKSFNKDIIEDRFDDIDDCIDKVSDSFDEADKDEKFKSYKIEAKKVLDKDDVEEIAEKLDDEFGIDEKKVKKVVRYKVSFDAKGKDNDVDLYVFVGKIKGHWSVIGMSTSKEYTISGLY